MVQMSSWICVFAFQPPRLCRQRSVGVPNLESGAGIVLLSGPPTGFEYGL